MKSKLLNSTICQLLVVIGVLESCVQCQNENRTAAENVTFYDRSFEKVLSRRKRFLVWRPGSNVLVSEHYQSEWNFKISVWSGAGIITGWKPCLEALKAKLKVLLMTTTQACRIFETRRYLEALVLIFDILSQCFSTCVSRYPLVHLSKIFSATFHSSPHHWSNPLHFRGLLAIILSWNGTFSIHYPALGIFQRSQRHHLHQQRQKQSRFGIRTTTIQVRFGCLGQAG